MIAQTIKYVIRMAAPPPELLISEWANNYRILSPEASAKTGRWRSIEYQKEIMDAFIDPKIEEIVVVGNSQWGKTEIINNVVGYHIDVDPCPMTVAQPSLEMARTWSKDRFTPMIRDTERLNGKVRGVKSKNSDNTILHKIFTGGNLAISGANSPASLAGRPKRIVIIDDADRCPVSAGTEGDPVRLLFKRTVAFWNRKKALFSTPTDQHSRIWKEFLLTDQRYFFVPCPKCGKFQKLEWKTADGKYCVRWDKDKKGKHLPKTAYYECQNCSAHLNDRDIRRMVKKGKFIATAPFNGKAGFFINEIYSVYVKLSETVQNFFDVKDDPMQLKTWFNTALAQIFFDRGEAPQWEHIFMRREQYIKGIIPKGGLLLVAGADVQKDRIEVEIVAYGRDKESWSVDYCVFSGDVATGEPFKKLDELMNETFEHELGGALKIRMLAVDSGYATQDVYNWTRKYPANRVMAIKGRDNLNAIVGNPKAVDILTDGKKYKRGVKYWPLGVGLLKSELYGFLRLVPGDEFPPGYCHFPDYDEEFFKQLTAESLHIINRRFMWTKDRARNEALDCRNYARGAATVLGIDVFTEETWRALEKLVRTKIKNQIITPKKIRKKMLSKGITI